MKWIETGKFKEWVEKHRIGPGMNDRGDSYSGCDGDVGEGWIPLLDRLATDLIAMGWDRDLHQVKEKFGELRFYIGAHTGHMLDRITEAEIESGRTCENCGNPGKPNDSGWIITLCASCRDERGKGVSR